MIHVNFKEKIAENPYPDKENTKEEVRENENKYDKGAIPKLGSNNENIIIIMIGLIITTVVIYIKMKKIKKQY